MVMSLLPTVSTYGRVSAAVFTVAISLTIEASPGVRDIYTDIETFPAKADMGWTVRSVEGEDQSVGRFQCARFFCHDTLNLSDTLGSKMVKEFIVCHV